MSHQTEIDQLRGRQLALIRSLSPEDAIEVLQAVPVTSAEEHDVIANILQRHMLINGLEKKVKDDG